MAIAFVVEIYNFVKLQCHQILLPNYLQLQLNSLTDDLLERTHTARYCLYVYVCTHTRLFIHCLPVPLKLMFVVCLLLGSCSVGSSCHPLATPGPTTALAEYRSRKIIISEFNRRKLQLNQIGEAVA